MKLLILVAAIIGLTVQACSGASMIRDNQVKKGEKAIGLCVDRYNQLTNSKVTAEVDRVYVLVIEGKLDLLFTRGEVGLFGRQSEDYRSFLSCGVLASEEWSLYHLGEFLKLDLISVPGIAQITDGPYEEAWVMLFFRDSDGTFQFEKKQPFEPDEMEINEDGTETN